jgi:hypothetical protein
MTYYHLKFIIFKSQTIIKNIIHFFKNINQIEFHKNEIDYIFIKKFR